MSHFKGYKVPIDILEQLTKQLELSNDILKLIQELDKKKGIGTKELAKFLKKNDKLTKIVRDNYEL